MTNTTTVNVNLDWRGTIIPWTLLSFNALIFLISLFRCFVLVFRERTRWPKIIKAIHVLLSLGLLTSCASNLVNILTGQIDMPIIEQSEIHTIVLGSLPGYIFSLTYLALVFFWVFRYFQKNSEIKKRVQLLFYGLVGLVFVLWIALWALLAIYKRNKAIFEKIHLIEILFAISLQILGSIAYAVFGTKLWCAMRRRTSSNVRQQTMQTKIGSLTIICTFIFLFRGILLAMLLWVIKSRDISLLVHISLEGGFIVGFPVVVMVILGTAMPRTVGARNYLEKSSDDRNGSSYFLSTGSRAELGISFYDRDTSTFDERETLKSYLTDDELRV